MYNVKALMISAIVACILILGGFHYSDRRSQSAYAVWAQEQNRVLNESQKAAEAARPKKEKKEEKKDKKDKKSSSDSKKAQESEASETTPAAEETAADETPAAQNLKYVASAGVNVRDSASLTGEKIGVLEKGAVLEEARKEGEWIRFRYKGKDGYVSADYVSVEEE